MRFAAMDRVVLLPSLSVRERARHDLPQTLLPMRLQVARFSASSMKRHQQPTPAKERQTVAKEEECGNPNVSHEAHGETQLNTVRAEARVAE